MRYITTDANSDFQLESGKRYFADFDISDSAIFENVLRRPWSEFRKEFVNKMYENGHTVQNTEVTMPDGYTLRFTFTATNPPHLILIIAIAVAIIVIGIGGGAGLYKLFKGLGEAVSGIAEIPGTLADAAVKNPIAVVAIVIAIGLFIVGTRL